ncbi:MAG: hypothetical protein R3C31_09310 [Hyphomonadaceae bacterium]
MMRFQVMVIVGLMLMGCAEQRPDQPALVATDECYLNVTYVSDNELSRRIWDHIQTAQYNLIDSHDRHFGAAQWYDRGGGRAAFVYNSDCGLARAKVQAVLEHFAEQATSPDVAQALREAKPSIREITQDQFENSEPL